MRASALMREALAILDAVQAHQAAALLDHALATVCEQTNEEHGFSDEQREQWGLTNDPSTDELSAA